MLELILKYSEVTKHIRNAGLFCCLVFFRLTFSEAVGNVIYDYGKEEPNNMSECLALAQAAYGHSGAYKKVVLCLCKQGQIAGAADYIQQVEHFSLGK